MLLLQRKKHEPVNVYQLEEGVTPFLHSSIIPIKIDGDSVDIKIVQEGLSSILVRGLSARGSIDYLQDIKVTVAEIKGRVVVLGFDAPLKYNFVRSEIDGCIEKKV